MTTVAIVSGGLDSVTMAHVLTRQGHKVDCLSFDYGQRHNKELQFAQQAASDIGGRWDLIDLRSLTKHIGGSSLTDDIAVPDGHYAHETMKITVVPNRNAIMLAIAGGVAVARKAEAVAIAVHTGDHFIYPDCRPEFIAAFWFMQNLAIEGFGEVCLFAPFIGITKSDIVAKGNTAGVNFKQTWSCYKGGEIHCGTCGTCVERKEAFALARIDDPTIYLG